MGASLLAVAKSMYYCKYKPTQGCFLRGQLIRLNRRGGGGKRRGLGPRNDVLSTCRAGTLRGGQRTIAVFFSQ